MSNTNIYTITSLPYVYRVENMVTGEFYIGYLSANKLPAKLNLPKYKTSSKKVRPIFDQFAWQIISEFPTADEAYDLEQKLIYNSQSDPLLLNESCYYGKERFRRFGPLSEEHKNKIKSNQPNRSGKNNPNYGKLPSDDTKRKRILNMPN